MAAGNFSGQKRREIVFPQDRVDVVDIADSVLKRNDKGRVAGYPPQKRSHPVQDQRLLRLVQPPEQSVKMAVIVVSTVPIMMVYPFLQKYFVKGVMVGALKG